MFSVTVQIDRYPCACKSERVIQIKQGFKPIYGVASKPMAEVTIQCPLCELYAIQTVEVNIITPDKDVTS